MSQKEIFKSERIREEYIRVQHPSGLTILLYPMKGYSSVYAIFGTHYGSTNRTFKTAADPEFVTVPDGIAHYLEHKMFESKEGDAFALFAKTGASANAFTSFDRTCYLFSCADHFQESLEILLSFVRDPYFTDENVQKEQGIIGQEIRMYDDNANWRVFFNLLGALYQNHPVKIDIAGTVESIAKIDKDLLYRCYRTFYSLQNMVLAIAGNFDPDEALAIADQLLTPDTDPQIQRSDYNEPAEIAKPEVVQQMEVSMPLFAIGYKMEPCSGIQQVQAGIETEIVNLLLCGSGSPLYRRLYDQG
ncbi:MAG TPA: insulinase family protein, partial [Firmicutes bacterium]|nr:insulinase family protein [Bacillota bacterium]